MRDDQIGDAEPLAAVQVTIDPLAEDGVDDAAAIPDADQPGPASRGPAAPPGKAQPDFEADAGVVHADQGIGRPRARPVHPKCLELFYHARNSRAATISSLIWINDPDARSGARC
jgi:hypothetical protein